MVDLGRVGGEMESEYDQNTKYKIFKNLIKSFNIKFPFNHP